MNNFHLSPLVWGVFCVASCLSPGTGQAENLLANGLFSEQKNGQPENWSVRDRQQAVSVDASEAEHPEVEQALRVDILCNGGSSYGEIVQPVSVQPNTVYRFAGDWRSSKRYTAFFQIKLIKDRKEIERIHLGWSDRTWQRVVRHVNSGAADRIEVICRYRQKKDYVGIVCWYTNLSFSRVSTKSEDRITTISKPIAPPTLKTPSFHFPPENPDLRVAKPGADQYVTPLGSGEKTGSAWDHARSAQDGGLQSAWDAVGPGNTLYLGSGEYQDAILVIKAGGSGPKAMKRLQGVDTGAGLPVIVGSLDMEKIKDGWQTMLVGSPNTGYWELSGVRFRNCSCAIKLYGGNVGVRFSHLDITRVREGFTLIGMTDPKAKFASRDVIISDCRVNIYTKRAIRVHDGYRELRIERVHADAGGKDWYRETFPIGFQIDSAWNMPVCRDIRYTDCTAAGNWHPNGKGYWNADGFCAERHVRDVTYLRCRAFNNTDGGWDDKSVNPVLIDCVSLCNKRNFRFWSNPGPARLRNCVSAFAVDHRNGKPGIGLWLAPGSHVQAENSTFHANGRAVSVEANGRPTHCELRNCLLAGDKNANLIFAENGGNVLKVNTIEATIGDAETDPRLTAKTPKWNESNQAFNSRRFPNHGARF